MDEDAGRLFLERIEGVSVKSHLESCSSSEEDMTKLFRDIGHQICLLHNENIVHGDLTTSNMILTPSGDIVLIDFGLSSTSHLNEDKAVDLYVLERAIASSHPNLSQYFENVLKEYSQVSNKSSAILARFSQVRQRGRKRDMIG